MSLKLILTKEQRAQQAVDLFKQLPYTKKSIAEKIGTLPQIITLWINGDRPIPAKYLVKLKGLIPIDKKLR